MPKVDLTNYEGREQAYIKHCLLEEYLPELAYKVGTTWDALVYVDGFAGPWQTTHPQHADASFGVVVEALRRCQVGLRETREREIQIESILVDREQDAFVKLKRFAELQNAPNFSIYPLLGEFIEKIPDIESIIRTTTKNAFRFIFLDPKGWADIPMRKLQSLLRNRSCEVLINLMTRHIVRFLDEPDRAESYNNLFGRKEVLPILQAMKARNATPYERAEHAVREYARSLMLLCGFRYVSSALILEPDKESIRYFLVYGTNHPRGVEVFKGAETKAASIQDEVRHDTHVRKTNQPTLTFDNQPPSSRLSSELRRFYSEKARNRVMEILSARAPYSMVLYSDLFCEAMAFPLVTPDDLVSWVRALEPRIKVLLSGSGGRKKPSPSEEDQVEVLDPKNLQLLP
jgi:three-Cys-motif partner protein